MLNREKDKIETNPTIHSSDFGSWMDQPHICRSTVCCYLQQYLLRHQFRLNGTNERIANIQSIRLDETANNKTQNLNKQKIPGWGGHGTGTR